MVALRLLKTRVQLQHALTFTRNEIGQRVPNWTTYARPWCERRRAYTLQTVAGAATRIQATVYRMRRVDGVVARATIGRRSADVYHRWYQRH